MEIICPHNDRVDCATLNCDSCGWNPVVAKKRLNSITGPERRYKIPFTGYCEVWAKTPEEAVDCADDGNMFFVKYDFGDPECLSKEDANELD